MNILIAVEELRFGGAQTFALRLAQALYEKGHKVWLYTSYDNLTEPGLAERLAPDVPVLALRARVPALDYLIQRAEGWLERRGLQVGLRRRLLIRHLRQCLQQHAIEVVSSNTFKSDELLAEALGKTGNEPFAGVPLVVTMHGDYEQFWAFYQQGKEYALPNYPRRIVSTLSRVNGIAYLADQNLTVLNPAIVPGIGSARPKCRRIYNGLEGRLSPEHARFSREALGIPANALVFGMVARGVPEKGWEQVVQAFEKLRAIPAIKQPVFLVLVGASPHLDKLQQVYGHDEHIRFLGFVNNPVDCVGAFDVGILASSLKESLPNSIAEYLYGGKAVISTEVGEIRNMLRPVLHVDAAPLAGEKLAGQLVPFPEPGQVPSVEALYHAMKQYLDYPDLLASQQKLAKEAFRKFDMEQCTTAYLALYQECRQDLQTVKVATT